MDRRLPGIAMAILCIFAGGMYAVHHGADFAVQEGVASKEMGQGREIDVTQPEISTEAELVNLNTADAAALDSLPGIGPAKAAAILEYRKSHGYFRMPEDLMKVPGIKEGTYGKLAALITVGELREAPWEKDGEERTAFPGVLLPERKLSREETDAAVLKKVPGGSP